MRSELGLGGLHVRGGGGGVSEELLQGDGGAHGVVEVIAHALAHVAEQRLVT